MADSINVAMLGASGRMGRSIIPLIAGDPSDLRLSGALVAPGDNAIGQDAGSFAGIGTAWPSQSPTIRGAPWPGPASPSISRWPKPSIRNARALPRTGRADGHRHHRAQRRAACGARGDRARSAGRARSQHEPRRQRAVQAGGTRGAGARGRAVRRRDLRGAPPPQGRRAERHGAGSRAGRGAGAGRRTGRGRGIRRGTAIPARARSARSGSAWCAAGTSSAITG